MAAFMLGIGRQGLTEGIDIKPPLFIRCRGSVWGDGKIFHDDPVFVPYNRIGIFYTARPHYLFGLAIIGLHTE